MRSERPDLRARALGEVRQSVQNAQSAIAELLAEESADSPIDKSGRRLAALAGGYVHPDATSAVGEAGRTLREAMESVQAGRVAAAYVDPFTGKQTDLLEHERFAAKHQLRVGAVNPYASLTEGGAPSVMVPVQLNRAGFTLRASAVVMGLPGINIVPQTSDRMRFPRIAGADASGNDLAIAGVPELTDITESTPDVDAVDLVAVKFGVYHVLSSEFVEDASEDALQIFEQNALIQLGLKIDYGMLEGNGAGQLVGIFNTPGISGTSVAALPTDLDKFSDTLYAAELANAEPSAWLMHPRSWNTLSKIKTGISSDKTTLLEPDPQARARTLLGLPVHQSTQISLTGGAGAGSWVAAVDPQQLVVGVRRSPLVEFSKDARFQSDGIAMKVTCRYSFGVLNPGGVSLATDVRAS